MLVPDDDPMRRVLGDADLFHAITAFQDGWPRWIPKEALEIDDCYGYLVTYVLEEFDLAELKRLHRLSQESSYYRDQVRMQFGGAMTYAVGLDRLDVVQWLHQQATITSNDSNQLMHAVLNRHDEIRDWLLENRPESYARIDPTLMDELVKNGQLDMMQWMDEHVVGAKYSPMALAAVAISGRMDILRYLDKHHNYAGDSEALDAAFALAPLEMVKHLHENRLEPCTVGAMDLAAGHGRFDTVRFLHENRTEGCSSAGFNYALEDGNLEMARFLRAHYDVTCEAGTVYTAVLLQNLDVLKYIHGHFPDLFTTVVLEKAAITGDIEVVNFVSARTRASAGGALRYAATMGHATIVKYLVENRHDVCVWSAFTEAKLGGQQAIASYLRPFVDPSVTYCVETNHSWEDEVPICQLRLERKSCRMENTP